MQYTDLSSISKEVQQKLAILISLDNLTQKNFLSSLSKESHWTENYGSFYCENQAFARCFEFENLLLLRRSAHLTFPVLHSKDAIAIEATQAHKISRAELSRKVYLQPCINFEISSSRRVFSFEETSETETFRWPILRLQLDSTSLGCDMLQSVMHMMYTR